MLYITFEDEDGNKKAICWHVGSRPDLDYEANVKKVQADGDELLYIQNSFNNIPYHKKARVQSWTGEIAKFIANHLGK